MPGNAFGELFRVATFGESHGPALGAVVEGCPPGLSLDAADIQRDLDRRRPGQSRYTTQRREADEVEILSGVFEGETTGTPIGLLIRNTDQRSKDYSEIKDKFRPGHADYTYWKKYGRRDYRGGGRASARETAMRVAAGAIARKFLSDRLGVTVRACLEAMGEVRLERRDWSAVHDNAFFSPDPERVPELEAALNAVRKEGDSIGAQIYVEALGLPAGLGEPVFDRLEADWARALMGINAVKGVAVGDGFDVVSQRGSVHGDEMDATGFLSNHAGGVLGGISTGQPLTARVAIKPTSSIQVPRRSLDVHGNEVEVVTKGRHDPCVGIRAVPIVEAMTTLTLMDHFLRDRAQNGERGDG
ncbi:chorismate synthase [Thiohalorhabdus denitrificans]|uniref:Chorismate synthase n=1 Tax=Thiohalorhabdus denitrificans TaxID=381306 RepID=A0A0P9CMG4_9GAMM|nr:chorismate synthase [Thiohalorhabdus denitrificans]KPV40262.1 chorismate synthase [Thiohalorhabdus denitrificans]SCX82170.1 chorismate synthase [Thiohalorhabdus denitrificans]